MLLSITTLLSSLLSAYHTVGVGGLFELLQVYVPKSGRTDDVKGLPFGYLKPNDNSSGSGSRKVYLYVYPYNFPQLFPLLNELVKVHKCKPPTEWCKRFDGYLTTMPLYYALVST